MVVFFFDDVDTVVVILTGAVSSLLSSSSPPSFSSSEASRAKFVRNEEVDGTVPVSSSSSSISCVTLVFLIQKKTISIDLV